MAGLRATAFLFRFEIEDMALYNVGIPLDLDLLAALGVQGLPVAILGEKQANLIAGAAVGGAGLADRMNSTIQRVLSWNRSTAKMLCPFSSRAEISLIGSPFSAVVLLLALALPLPPAA